MGQLRKRGVGRKSGVVISLLSEQHRRLVKRAAVQVRAVKAAAAIATDSQRATLAQRLVATGRRLLSIARTDLSHLDHRAQEAWWIASMHEAEQEMDNVDHLLDQIHRRTTV